jgi:hypothetical protein
MPAEHPCLSRIGAMSLRKYGVVVEAGLVLPVMFACAVSETVNRNTTASVTNRPM